MFVSGESEEVTPVSGGSELDFNTNDATAGSTADCDVTVMEDIESSLTMSYEEDLGKNQSTQLPTIDSNNRKEILTPKVLSPLHLCSNKLQLANDNYHLKHIDNSDRIQAGCSRIFNDLEAKFKNEKNKKTNLYDKNLVSEIKKDKWWSSKEKFLDSYPSYETTICESNIPKPGAVIVKECYIEPPRMNRISRSFHGKTPTSSSCLDISNTHRRASDIPVSSSTSKLQLPTTRPETKRHIESKNLRHKFLSQLSQPCDTGVQKMDHRKTSLTNETSKNPRFTTVKVDEAEHAASAGYSNTNRITRVSSCTGLKIPNEQCSDKKEDLKASASETEIANEQLKITYGFKIN